MTVDRIWYILGKKLNGEASHDELKELSKILAQHPELYYPIQNITDVWKLDKQHDKQEAFIALQHHLMRLADSRGEIIIEENSAQYHQPARSISLQKHKYVIYAFTVASAIAVFSYFLFFNSTANSKTKSVAVKVQEGKINEISTKTGSHSKIILPDGSLVWLNGGSRLTYDKTFNQSETREVELTGEAYFDVVKNALKPFIIHTHQMDIKVLGTAFNVKSYPEDKSSEASLIRGSIEVTMRQGTGEKIILKPKDKLIVTGYTARLAESEKPGNTATSSTSSKISSISYLPSDSTIIETSWIDDRLIFRDKSFAELSADMERKYGIAFSFQNEEVKQLMFSANFKNENIEQALKALQLANRFSYTLIKDTVIISN
ncbi:MAG: FecR family protein [Agriterribacter sp.]